MRLVYQARPALASADDGAIVVVDAEVHNKVSALLTQLPWTHHLPILGHGKLRDEHAYYLHAAITACRPGSAHP